MKSFIKNGESATNSYPCLKEAISQKGKIVVLFSEPEKGTIIWSDNNYHTVGAFSSTWIECFFDAFNGTIELSNN